MSIQSEITRINQARSDIRQAIIDGGIDVPSDTKIDGMAEYIRQIYAIPDFPQLINYTMLYDEGDECEDVTGGWTGQGDQTRTKNPNNLYISLSSSADSSGFYTQMLDLTGYEKAIAKASAVGTYADIGYCWVNFWSKLPTVLGTAYMQRQLRDNGYRDDYNIIFENAISVKSCDISTAGTGSLCVGCHTDRQYAQTITMYMAALLKSDDWQQWVTYGGLNPSSFADLDTLLSDTSALSTLFNVEGANSFLLKQCTGTVMCGIFGSDSAFGSIPSALKTKMSENAHWSKFANIYGRTI